MLRNSTQIEFLRRARVIPLMTRKWKELCGSDGVSQSTQQPGDKPMSSQLNGGPFKDRDWSLPRPGLRMRGRREVIDDLQ